MNVASGAQMTLVGALWPVRRASRPALRAIALMLLGTVALWLSAKIQVPLWPVPITMQTFVVLTLGVAYGGRLAGATLLLYLAEGAVGLPVFAKGGGLGYLVGPTAGYLFGFVIAAAIVGRLAERGWDRSAVTAGAAMAIGNLVIYAAGIAWLGAMIGYGTAIDVGLLPFLVGDALKIALGACLLPLAWKLIGR
ncbi:MAG TPA: biotin transporter BioY [Dongiaceae bacterium]|nr:biotin transporter BioY [Dongiaceae bacterium]